jgi:CBS domain containing-hemolysin-like protein
MADPSFSTSTGPLSVLDKIVERLRSPALLFGIGGGIVLLLAASVVTQSQAPLYVAAIVVVLLAALIVYAIATRGSVFAPRVEARNIKTDAQTVVGGQRGGSASKIFKPTVKASEDLIVGSGSVVGGFSAESQTKEREPEKPGS